MSALEAQAEMLANRLRKKSRKLRGWAKRHGLEAYRLYDRDIPEIPLVVDRYRDQLYMAVYARTPAVPDETVAAWRNAASAAFDNAHVAVKVRERKAEGAQYEVTGARAERFVVKEGSASFWVELEGHLDTGLFLDHRDTRARVGAESAGKRVLNLYAYTGSFGVYALLGGAAHMTHVDLSKTYTRWARDNAALNEVDDARAEWLVDDAMVYLAETGRSETRFDLAVVDPPTFSRSKRMAQSFDVRRDHDALLRRVHAVMNPGGVVYFSTNARGFQLSEGLPFSVVVRIDEETVPIDFEGRHAHRAWRLIA